MKDFKESLSQLHNQQIRDLVKRISCVFILLYFFLIGVKCFSSGLQLMGGDFALTLFSMTGMPLVSLMIGMLATVLLQSSSVTTSIIVGLVSAGTISVEGAVPMMMGSNLGTSVTNTLVSLGYASDTGNFKKAFAAATVHDFFNILSVIILLPLEIFTGFIEKAATYMSSILYGSVSGINYQSPIKAIINPPVKAIKNFALENIDGQYAGFAMIGFAGIIIIISLGTIVRTMKTLIENHKTELVNKLLTKSAYGAILFGAIITVAVQSSSITTSLLIPMAGSGLLTVSAIYPITIGANIGTTVTALMAALAGNMAGLTIALVHLLFNVFGGLIFFPILKMRQLPILLANKLAESIEKTRMLVFAYVGIIFFALPIGIIFVGR
ncbi:hypothetical protein A9Q84_00330 [Halobacteriovorax marinus]|uniref:Uncharacterized protein n=1 Tax=Halobacteriovorax marinus TaxID=97084 RepID=A0A1Y5FBQ4_9BACT|nr:hypothetical protein A9Q84_00330 [Halobacteriovorax marinus]